ncbi:MAG: hypothetical protein DRQ52_11845 [Gammaproteobacteria bacterium]|nr:MAG: hypothetical protein DRQ52_11845 [Gammaproteobacteria bacterium]
MTWARLLKRLSPYYRQTPVGRKRVGLEVQLRIYFLQQWYGLSDPAAEEACMTSSPCAALLDSNSMKT